MWQILIVTIILIGIGFALLSIKILIKRNGRFPHTHIGGNKALNKKGIYCATTQDKLERKKAINIKPLALDGDFESNTTSC